MSEIPWGIMTLAYKSVACQSRGHIMTTTRKSPLADLRSAIEFAAGVEITVRAPCPGVFDGWFAQATVDGEETDTGYASRTVGTATGNSEQSVLMHLAMDLQPRAFGKLDALIAECAKPLPAYQNSVSTQGKAA